MSDSKKLLNWLLCTEIDEGINHSFTEFVSSFAIEELGKDASEANIYAAGRSRRLWNYILKNNEILEKQDLDIVFHPLDDMAMLFSSPIKYNAQSRKKLKLKYRWKILSWLFEMDWRDYEYIGAFCLYLHGGENVFITSHGDEGGIDFGGIVNYFGPSQSLHSNGQKLRVIGQSKKFNGAANVNKVREMNDVMASVRKLSPKQTKQIPSEFRVTSGPLICWMAAHSGFQSGASSLARENGIITCDSVSIAEEILRSKQIPLSLCANELAIDIQSEFDAFKSSL